MKRRICICLAVLAAMVVFIPVAAAQDKSDKIIRVGIIGPDTSHVPAFTGIFNDPKNEGDLAGFKVVAGFPGGSKDTSPWRILGPSSRNSTIKAKMVASVASSDAAPFPAVRAGLARVVPRLCSFGALRSTQACR